MSTKNYVLDTNVLINDPNSIFRFEDNNVYIPIFVLEELDGLKNDPSEKGRNAREAIRNLDDFRGFGNLINGIKIHEDLENSGNLFVYSPKEKSTLTVAVKDSVDNEILQSTLNISKSDPNKKTILVTMDINLRVRAEALGIQVAPYEYQSVDVATLNNSVIEISVTPDVMNDFHRLKSMEIDQDIIDEYGIEYNSSVMLKCDGMTGLCRYYKKGDNAIPTLNKLNLPPHIMGLKPRNKEQQFALDLLLDENVKLVTLMGSAGCGKSLLSIAAALYHILETGLYSKLLIARPIMPLGKDIGFLPGTLEEKFGPWMKPIYDNLDYLLMAGKSKKKFEKLFEEKIIEIEPLVYIRGRSIINQIMIIDEAQSLNPHETKTIISRCGENTKIIFTGDIEQIDNPYVTKSSNGLSVAVKKINNNPIVGHIKLEKGERSELANLAVENM